MKALLAALLLISTTALATTDASDEIDDSKETFSQCFWEIYFKQFSDLRKTKIDYAVKASETSNPADKRRFQETSNNAAKELGRLQNKRRAVHFLIRQNGYSHEQAVQAEFPSESSLCATSAN